MVAQQREQDRLDSIAEVERLIEIHRQDSIAQVERKKQEHEEFMNNHPLLLSTFLSVKRYDGYNDLSYNNNFPTKLKELGFEKINSAVIEFEAGTDGSSWEVSKVTFQRDKTSITLITQKENIQNVYEMEIYFGDDIEMDKFLQSAIKMGFNKENNSFYSFGGGWGINIKGDKVTLYYAP